MFTIIMRLGVADPSNPQTEQRLGFTGPLVKPADSTELNMPVNLLFTTGDKTAQRVANTIREARLIRNDGHGNLQFDIVVRKDSERGSEDRIRLTVARIHQPVRSLILN